MYKPTIVHRRHYSPNLEHQARDLCSRKLVENQYYRRILITTLHIEASKQYTGKRASMPSQDALTTSR